MKDVLSSNKSHSKKLPVLPGNQNAFNIKTSCYSAFGGLPYPDNAFLSILRGLHNRQELF